MILYNHKVCFDNAEVVERSTDCDFYTSTNNSKKEGVSAMPKKLLSLLTVLAFVFSLIRIVPVRAEEYVEAKADKITSGVSESRMINGLTEEDWLRIMEEQEKLMTPEIRASIRENAMKSLEGKNFKNGDFAMKNAKPSDYGFKTKTELDKWLAMPFEPYKAAATQNALSIDPTELSIAVNALTTLYLSGYTNEADVSWTALDGTVARQRPWPGGNRERFVDGLAPGIDWIVASEPEHTSATCTIEVISISLNCGTSTTISVGEAFTTTATTTHSDSRIAFRTSHLTNTSVVNVTENAIIGLSEGTTTVLAYLVDRPTVLCSLSVTVVTPEPAISLILPEGNYYYGQPIPITVETTPANADITWSVMPENAGYFVGNTFYPQKIGWAYITATMNGTNITKSEMLLIRQRTITLNTPTVERTLLQGSYFLDISISHGSLYDLEYDIDNPDIVEIDYYLGQPYITPKSTGHAVITISAPGSNTVTMNVHITNGIGFVSSPTAIYSGQTYVFDFITYAPEDSISIMQLSDLNNPDYSINYSTVISDFYAVGNNKYRFTLTAGEVGEHFYLTAFEGATLTEAAKEYTVNPATNLYGIVRNSPSSQVVYNEETDNNGKITVRFNTYMTISGVNQLVNTGIDYTVIENLDGISCSMNGSVLTITPTRVDHNLDGLYPNYTAHKTGTITIEASLRDLPSKSILYYVTVSCDDAFVPGDIGASGMYQLVPNEDVSRFSESGLFTHAFTMLGVNVGFGGNVGRGRDICPQMNFFNSIRNSRVFAIHSHGEVGSMLINCDDNISATSDQIRALHNGYFNSTDLLISLTCYGAANDGTGSILDAFMNKGVSCTIGFGDSVYSEDAQKFEQAFYFEIINNSAHHSTIRDVYNAIMNNFGADISGDCYINFD